MSDEIRPLEGFSPMRQMNPHYGGGEIAAAPSQGLPGQELQSVQGAPGPEEGHELAFSQEPMFSTAPSMQPPGAPEAQLSQVMKLLDDPAKHGEFCKQFKDYMDKVNPDQKLMPPSSEQGMKMPRGGGGIPMIPGLGQGQNPKGTGSALDHQQSGTSGSLNDLHLTGNVDDNISQLQNALQQLESQKSQLESQIPQLEQEIQQLETQLQDLETQKQDLETQKQQKQQEANQAKQEQQKLQTQKSQLQANQNQLNSQKQSLSTQITTLGAQITEMTAQIATLRASAGSLHAQAAALLSNPYTAAAGAAMEAQALALDAQATAMEAQKTQLQIQKQQAECQLQQVEAQLQQNLSQQQQVDQQLQVVNNKVQKAEQELSQIDSKLRDMEQKVSQVKDQLNEKKKTLADKKSQLAQIKVKIAQVKQKLQEQTALKNKGQQTDPNNPTGQGNPNAGFGNPLALLGALGGGKPPMPGNQEQMAEKAKDATSPGGPINMRAGQANPNQPVTKTGANPTQQQVGQNLEEVAAKYGIPPEIMKAVAWNDSKFNASSRGEDGNRGAVHIDAASNPDYDAARGNKESSYNIEYGAQKLHDQFERTSDWKIASEKFYNKNNPGGEAMGSQIMALSASRPWEHESGNVATQAQNLAQRQGGRRG
jgi:peptidoglycan hydrolase CwlO-like protein